MRFLWVTLELRSNLDTCLPANQMTSIEPGRPPDKRRRPTATSCSCCRARHHRAQRHCTWGVLADLRTVSRYAPLLRPARATGGAMRPAEAKGVARFVAITGLL